MQIAPHPEFERELAELARSDPREAQAVRNAIRFLSSDGPALGFPWSSAVRSVRGLRELRPRGGRSRVRVLYVRRERGIYLLAIAPEANSDPPRFRVAIARAQQRADDEDGALCHA